MKRKRKVMISVLIIFMGLTIIGAIFFLKVKFLVQSSNNSEKKIPDNQIYQDTFDTIATNNQTVFEAITKVEDSTNNSSGKLNRSNRKTIDNPDLEALEELSLNTLPTQFKHIAKLINMEVTYFNESTNETIQKIIDRYNTEMSSIIHIKFSGSCTWSANWGKPNPFEIDLTRKGFNVVCQCEQECITVKNGIALFTDKVDKDCLDTYYLMAFAVFDPKNYTHISDESIEITVEDDHITKDVYEVSSPTKIQATFKKADELRSNNRAVPEKMTLEITPETVEF